MYRFSRCQFRPRGASSDRSSVRIDLFAGFEARLREPNGCNHADAFGETSSSFGQSDIFHRGEIARSHPALVREIASEGHEVGSHSWDHQRVHRFTAEQFRADAMKCKDELEQVIGQSVVGFRAPTFSIVKETGWAIDVLAECGFEYDSSIFPVIHDRYGIPDAPRRPFLASGPQPRTAGIAPLTYRILGMNLPVAGGGYFRLFPLAVMRSGIRQSSLHPEPSVAMLYFHPWGIRPRTTEASAGPLFALANVRGHAQNGCQTRFAAAGIYVRPCHRCRAIAAEVER